MPISKFLTTFPNPSVPDSLVVFSTRTGSKTVLRKDQFEGLDAKNISDENRRLLTRLGIIVEDPAAETAAVASLFDRTNRKSTTLTVTIVMNLDCNFACPYCYEEGVKSGRYMSTETADQLIAFIERQLTPDKKNLVVDFYGGEPLLSLPLIEYISERLVALTQSREVVFSATMVTNGSLLKRPVAERLTALGLRMAKVTLDGPAHVHDRYRPFKSGAGSFDIILKNIEACADVLTISVGGNFDRASYPYLVSLLDELEARGLTPDRLGSVKFDPIVDTGKTDMAASERHGHCLTIDEPWALEAEVMLREEILKRGYRLPKVMTVFCAVENKDALVVNYNGDIYKCPGFLGHSDFVVGTVFDGIKDYHDTYQLDVWKNDDCLACTYLPLCYGGCRYMTYLKHDRIDTVSCRKDYYDAQLEPLITQDITYKDIVF